MEASMESIKSEILQQLIEKGYAARSVEVYSEHFRRLIHLGLRHGITNYCETLRELFLKDEDYERLHEEKTRAVMSRRSYNRRVIHFIETYLETGVVDTTPETAISKKRVFGNAEFQTLYDEYAKKEKINGLNISTIRKDLLYVEYFLLYLENKGYTTIYEVKSGDILEYFPYIKEKYKVNTAKGAATSLKKLVAMVSYLKQYELELPAKLPQSRVITAYYTEEENARIYAVLCSDKLPNRDKAIGALAFLAGLRAVDICNLKHEDIDWDYDLINIVQQKTKKPVTVPLSSAIGNALFRYLTEERPDKTSPYVFISNRWPFKKIPHSQVYYFICKILKEACVEPKGRISGTRMTRHNYATKLLRKGVPLKTISKGLGHSSMNSTMRYLATDELTMKSLIIPMPKLHENT